MMNEMTVYDQNQDVQVYRDPTAVLAEAKKAATALAQVVAGKKKRVIMNGEQYLEFEDWQTVGRFYGVTAKVVSTEFMDLSGVQGFQAKAVAIRADGMEVSAAESMCLNDEPNWKSKPLFQLRSMAQTRACSKALRNVLAWVVVLAGYKPTPAEEIQDMVNGNGRKAPVQAPQKKAPKDPNEPATEPQLKAIHAILNRMGVKDDFEKHAKISRIIGMPEPEVITSMSLLKKGQASTIIETLTNEGSGPGI